MLFFCGLLKHTREKAATKSFRISRWSRKSGKITKNLLMNPSAHIKLFFCFLSLSLHFNIAGKQFRVSIALTKEKKNHVEFWLKKRDPKSFLYPHVMKRKRFFGEIHNNINNVTLQHISWWWLVIWATEKMKKGKPENFSRVHNSIWWRLTLKFYSLQMLNGSTSCKLTL